MKKILLFLTVILSGILLVSCVDEDDFDFDSIAQTTVNPTIVAPLFESTIQLSDFFNMDSLCAQNEGLELIGKQDEYGEYFEFAYRKSDTLNVSDFIEEIQDVEDVSLSFFQVNIPDVSALAGMGIDLGNSPIILPDPSSDKGDLSFRIENPEDGTVIDSIILSEGKITISPNTQLPFDCYLELSSSSLFSAQTHQPFSRTIQLSDVNGQMSSSEIDLSDLLIKMKDSSGFDDSRFVDLRYRLRIDLSSNQSFTGGYFDIGALVEISPLKIELAYGKLADIEIPVTDTITLVALNDTNITRYIQPGNLNLEKLKFNLSAYTNIGINGKLLPHLFTVSQNGTTHDLLTESNEIEFNRALHPGDMGISEDISLESDANALEMLPEKFVYDLKIRFGSSTDQSGLPNFANPYNSFVILKTLTTLPLKLKITNLKYEEYSNAFEFTEGLDYVKSGTLKMYLESSFPADAEINFMLTDENGTVFDSLFTNAIKIKGAPVDQNGNILAPKGEYVEATITSEKYDNLRRADKLKFIAVLNTSKDASGNKPFVRFKKDSYIKVKVSAKVVGNISF